MNYRSFTLRNIVTRLRILRDRLCGLDFLTVTHPEDVGLDPKYTHRSSPSGDKYLEKTLHDLNITSEDSVIDIGCGKGSAMRTMLKFPFTRVDGVELAEQIATVATRNFKRLNSNRTTVFVCDASRFSNLDSYNFVYFYNPFPHSVMSPVIDALIQSVQRSDRELVIVYKNAVCDDIIVNSGMFSKMGFYPNRRGNGISVYSNRNAENSRLSIS